MLVRTYLQHDNVGLAEILEAPWKIGGVFVSQVATREVTVRQSDMQIEAGVKDYIHRKG